MGRRRRRRRRHPRAVLDVEAILLGSGTASQSRKGPALVRLLLAERVARAAPLRRILRPLRVETLHVHRVSGTAWPHPDVPLLPEQRTGLHRSGQATTAIASATPVRARPGRRATQAGSASADPARVAGPE